jgi:hypothetical protein
MKIEIGSLYKHKSLNQCYLICSIDHDLRICDVIQFGVLSTQYSKFANNHTKHTTEFIEDCCLLISE